MNLTLTKSQTMKHLLCSLTLLLSGFLQGQNTDVEVYNTKQWYASTEGEMIFSFANIDAPSGATNETILRWSPVFNFAAHANYDFSRNVGFNAGLGIRNVGFIQKFDPMVGSNIDKSKHRTYNLGLPVGFKFGRLDQNKPFFVFAGYELELAMQYKEKEFDGNDKENKSTGWFSDKTEIFQQAAFLGVQLPSGISVKFKYYLTDFFNSDYTEIQSVAGQNVEVKPYANFNANIFYFSLEFNPFQDVNIAYKNAAKRASPPASAMR